MTFTPAQTDALKAPLDRRHVKSRKQAGRELSYVEGWHAISEANRIFGFSAWDRETIELRQLGDARDVDGKWRVAYLARVRVLVRTEGGEAIFREGAGYGSGIDRDLGSAHESALKEAETDAMKRALMTFGNPFGLALYDKDQANVADHPMLSAREQSKADADDMIEALGRKSGTEVDAFLTHTRVRPAYDALASEDRARVDDYAEARRHVPAVSR